MSSRFPKTAIYYLAVPVRGDEELQQLASLTENTDWTLAPEETSRVAPTIQVIRREVELGPEGPEVKPDEIYRELGDYGSLLSEPTMQMIQSPGLDDITKFNQGIYGVLVPRVVQKDPSESTTSPDGKGAKAPAPADSSGGEDKKKEAGKSPPADGDAAAISAALAALGDPAPLWAHLKREEKQEAAKELIPRLYDDRKDFARRAEWVVAPEMVLLESCPEGHRDRLAREMLEARAGLTPSGRAKRMAEADLEKQRAALASQEVALARQRVALAGEGVALAREAYEHMKEWRKISTWGVVVLLLTTVFSLVAVAKVLFDLMPEDKVSDVAAPIIIFVLALFAISPAVLLLRERPLEGLDKWFPGKSDEGSGGKEEPSKKSSDPTSKDMSGKEAVEPAK